jgi:rhomboid family GlyGly-CTERM serine protease
VARGLRLKPLTPTRGQVVWVTLALLALLPALAIGIGAQPAIDFRPTLVTTQPWRLWSAAWVHYSAAHLAVNAAGALLVAALGVAARLPTRAAVAWALAWPLMHALLAVEPRVAYYGGLSGLLHAGVAVSGAWLACGERGRPRAIGLALLGGLALKVLGEAPWRDALPTSAALGIVTVPLAHASGALCGAISGMVAAFSRHR